MIEAPLIPTLLATNTTPAQVESEGLALMTTALQGLEVSESFQAASFKTRDVFSLPTSTVFNLEMNWSILVNTSSLANSHCLTCCPSLKNFWIFLLTSSKVSLKKEQISIAFWVFSYASSASDLKISAGSRYVRAYKHIKKVKKYTSLYSYFLMSHFSGFNG